MAATRKLMLDPDGIPCRTSFAFVHAIGAE
jgi:hypothetical protein